MPKTAKPSSSMNAAEMYQGGARRFRILADCAVNGEVADYTSSPENAFELVYLNV